MYTLFVRESWSGRPLALLRDNPCVRRHAKVKNLTSAPARVVLRGTNDLENWRGSATWNTANFTAYLPVLTIDATNNKIDLQESDHDPLVATLSSGQYANPSAVAAQVEAKLNAAGTFTYEVSWNSVERKISIEGTSPPDALVIDGTNNKIDFIEAPEGEEKLATITPGTYDDMDEFATEVQTQLNASGSLVYTVTWDEETRKFTVTAALPDIVVDATNNKIDFMEASTGDAKVVTLTSGVYATPAALATEVQTRLNAVGDNLYTVTWVPGDNGYVIEVAESPIVVAAPENEIIFRDPGLTDMLTASIAPGTYANRAAFAAAVKTALDSAIDATAVHTVTWNSEMVTFDISSTMPSVVVDGTNNKVDFLEADGGTELTATLTPGSYATPAALATQLQTQLNAAGDNTYTVVWNEEARTFTITAVLPSVVVDGTNNKVDFKEASAGEELHATITPGTYTRLALAAELKTQLDAAGESTYTVTWDAEDSTYTVLSSGGEGVILSILWETGENTLTSAASILGFDPGADSTGALTYTGSGLLFFSILWETGTNNATAADVLYGFDMDNADSTGETVYVNGDGALDLRIQWNDEGTSDVIAALMGYDSSSQSFGRLSYSSTIPLVPLYLDILWETGVNTDVSAAVLLGYDPSSDSTGSLSYSSIYSVEVLFLSLLWNSGASADESAASSMGFDPSEDSTGAVTYSSDVDFEPHVFSLLWDSGDNADVSAAQLLGFDPSADDTGGYLYTADNALPYTGDREVVQSEVLEIPGFDMIEIELPTSYSLLKFLVDSGKVEVALIDDGDNFRDANETL